MKRMITLLALLSGAALATAQTAPPLEINVQAPPPVSAPDPAQVQAISEMLRAIRIAELTMHGMRESARKLPPIREFFDYVLSHVSSEDIVRMYVPVYLPHLSTADARMMAAAFNRPVAQRSISVELDKRQGKARVLSAAEQRENDAFDKSEPARMFYNVQKKVEKDAPLAFQRWLGAYQLDLFRSVMRPVAAHTEAYAQSGMTAPPTRYVPEKIGLSYVDRTGELIAETSWRNAVSSYQLEADMASLGINELLTPATLAAPKKVAAGQEALKKMDLRVEGFVAEMDATMKNVVEQFKGIDMPGKADFQRGLQMGFERHLHWSIRFAENQRSLVDMYRRILNFAAARAGKISVQEGQLVMPDAADRATYSALVDEVMAEVARTELLRAEVMGRVSEIAKGKMPAALPARP